MTAAVTGVSEVLAALYEARVPVLRRLPAHVAVTPEEELVIYRVAQEALTNIARHAEATWAQLELRDSADMLVLTVRDDGRGIPDDVATTSHGIRGMRERAMLVGATLVIDSRPGRGTVIELSIPR